MPLAVRRAAWTSRKSDRQLQLLRQPQRFSLPQLRGNSSRAAPMRRCLYSCFRSRSYLPTWPCSLTCSTRLGHASDSCYLRGDLFITSRLLEYFPTITRLLLPSHRFVPTQITLHRLENISDCCTTSSGLEIHRSSTETWQFHLLH